MKYMYLFLPRQLFDIEVSMSTFVSYVSQIISAISSGITDISFDTLGYAWQISNCILTASYSVSSSAIVLEIC